MKNRHRNRNNKRYSNYISYQKFFALVAQEFIQDVIYHFSQNCSDYTRRKELVGTKQLLNHGAIFRDKKGNYHSTRREMELSNDLIDLRMLYKTSQNDLMMAKRTIRSKNEQIVCLNETIDILQMPNPQPNQTIVIKESNFPTITKVVLTIQNHE